jgi:hypothetical protein
LNRPDEILNLNFNTISVTSPPSASEERRIKTMRINPDPE